MKTLPCFQNKKNSFLVYLQDGVLKVDYSHRIRQRRQQSHYDENHRGAKDHNIYEMEAKDIFDNGVWKDIKIVKAKTVLSLVIDHRKSVSMRVPKKLQVGKQLHIGGVSSEMLTQSPPKDNLEALVLKSVHIFNYLLPNGFSIFIFSAYHSSFQRLHPGLLRDVGAYSAIGGAQPDSRGDDLPQVRGAWILFQPGTHCL